MPRLRRQGHGIGCLKNAVHGIRRRPVAPSEEGRGVLRAETVVHDVLHHLGPLAQHEFAVHDRVAHLPCQVRLHLSSAAGAEQAPGGWGRGQQLLVLLVLLASAPPPLEEPLLASVLRQPVLRQPVLLLLLALLLVVHLADTERPV